jgi:phage gp46-like protein
MDVLIRANEACAPDPFLLWDSIFDPAAGVADWALAGNAPLNSGGLAANAALDTAITLCLFTDAQLPATHPLAYLVADGDFRGYWGDGIDVRADLGETALGSYLWVLQRAPLTPKIAQWAQSFALLALAPLQQQGVVVRIDAAATIIGTSMLQLSVQLYGSDGAQIYDRQFDLVWQQLGSVG